MLKSINPATEALIEEHHETSPGDCESRLALAQETFRRWRAAEIPRREELARALSSLLRERRDRLAETATREMGKPITQARAEVEKCGLACDFFAEHARRFLANRYVETDAQISLVRYQPLGPVLAIMPWNFPYWQVFRCAVPAILAGNVVLLKHASNVCGVARAIEELFVEAGFPVGTLTSLYIDSSRAEELVGHPALRAVALTGSERAGRKVGAAAGRHLKKAVLELGGSDPFVVLDDADIPATAKAAAMARTQNTGQSCIAAKRFIVEESIAEQFLDAFVAEMESLRVGDPGDDATDLGPLARDDLRETLHQQVEESLQAGAKLCTGGKPRNGTGYFYPPTVLDAVQPGMRAFDEETFGPVAAVVRAKSRDEAVALANMSRYGLGASIWTGNAEVGAELTAQLDAGSVFVNEVVKSDPRLPFGGIKESGFGRELSEEGIREFVNTKAVWVH